MKSITYYLGLGTFLKAIVSSHCMVELQYILLISEFFAHFVKLIFADYLLLLLFLADYLQINNDLSN